MLETLLQQCISFPTCVFFLARSPPSWPFSLAPARPSPPLPPLAPPARARLQMANMLEGGGKTPVLPPSTLQAMGFKLVAYPLSLLGVSIRAMQVRVRVYLVGLHWGGIVVAVSDKQQGMVAGCWRLCGQEEGGCGRRARGSCRWAFALT